MKNNRNWMTMEVIQRGNNKGVMAVGLVVVVYPARIMR